MASLYELTQDVLYLQALLEEGEIDEEVYRDSVESMCVESKLEDICKVMKNLEAKASAYKAEIDRMTARKKTLDNGVKRLKESMLTYMLASNTKKKEAGLFTLSVGKSKSVTITDISKLPKEYVFPQEVKVDKTGLGKALRAGEEIDGAELTESEYISIR